MYFIYLFLGAPGLRCCARAGSHCCEWGLLSRAVPGLPTVAAPVVGALDLVSLLLMKPSRIRDWTWVPLCWQEDSLALNYQRSPKCFSFFVGLPWDSLDFSGLGQRMKLPMRFQRKHTSSLYSGVGASHTREFSVWMALFGPVRYLLKYILGLKIHYSPEVGLPDKDSGNWRE